MSIFTRQRQPMKLASLAEAARNRARSRALSLEYLEERVVLSTITWNNRVIGDNLFTTASNWLGGVVPGPNDDAVINRGSGTVTFSSGNLTVRSLSTNSTTTFAVTGGTFNITANSTLGPVIVSGGTLGGNASLTLTNTLAWTSGTLTGAGTTEVVGAATLGATTGTTASTLSLTGGRSLTFDTSAVGGSNGAGLTLNVGGGSIITNRAASTLTFVSNTSVVSTGTPPPGSIVNLGTLTTNGGTGTTTIGIPIIDSGTIQAQTGTLSLGVGTTFSSTASLKASAGATLNFASGTYSIPVGATATGAGGLLVNGGTIGFSGSYGLTGLTRISSGELDFNAPATAGSLLLEGGVLGGTGALVVTGQTTWTGGTMTGSGSTEAKGGLVLGNALAITPSTLSLSGARSLINSATATANGQGVTLNLSGGASVTNKSGATFTFTANGTVANNGGTPAGGTFINQGTLGTNGGTGTTSFGVPIINSGTLLAQTGTLAVGVGSTFSSTSQLNAGAGAFINFSSGTYAIPAGASSNGAGGFLINGATVTDAGSFSLTGLTQIDSGELDFNAAATAGSLLLNGGILGGTGALLVSGQTTWTGGTMAGPGSTEAKGSLSLGFATGTTSSTLTLAAGRNLINDTTATGPANGQPLNLNLGGGSTITNQSGATFTFNTNSSIANGGGTPAGGTFVNLGTLGTNGGTGTTVFGIPIVNSGTLQAITGTLAVSPGSTFSSTSQLKVSAGATLNFQFSSYALPAGSSVTGAGNLLVNGATVTTAGAFNLTGLTQIDSGEIDFNAAATAGSLFLNGGTLGGSGALLVSGATTWNSGSMIGSGSTEAKGGLTLGFTTGTTQATLSLVGRSLINDAVANVGVNGAGVVLNVSNGAKITNIAGATINVLSNSTFANNGGSPAGGTFVNSGTFVVNGGTGTTTVGLNVTNNGTLSVQTGTLALTGGLTNFNAATSTISGGTYLVKGVLQFPNASIVSNNASITLSSTTADIQNLSGVSAFGTFTTTNPGVLTLTGGKNLTVGAFTNSGSVVLSSPSVFTTTGAYVQTKGLTSNSFGTITSTTNTVTINGGSFNVRGTINGNLTVNSSATIRPGGTGPGAITVNGNYIQNAGAILAIDLGGTTAGTQYDQIVVNGTASLNGTLTTGLINTYVPGAGVSYRILSFTSVTGNFSTFTGLNLGPAVLSPVFTATALNLVDNVAPKVPTQTPTINSAGAATITLTATDPETATSNLVFTITSLPLGTVTTTGGAAVTVGQTFTGGPVTLIYQAPSVIYGIFTDSFKFTVSDDGTPNGVVGTTSSTVNLTQAQPVANAVSIFGAPGNATILVANSGGNLQVTLNGVVNNTSIPVGSISQLNVVGGNGSDTIQISGLAVPATLTGGSGTNTFIVAGGSGADVFNLNSSTSVGFNGATITATSPLSIVGGGGADTFNILAPNIGVTITAGTGSNNFVIANGASITTAISGVGGSNTIDVSASTTPVSLNLAGSTLTGLSLPFTNIQNVIGNSGVVNTITGPAAGSTYNLTGANAGNVGGLAFSGFTNITGGAGNDTFVLSPGVTFTGVINGGGGADTLNESAVTTPIAWNVGTSTVSGLASPFVGIQTVIGGSNAGNTLTGPSTGSTYNITGANAGNVGGFVFSGFGNIVSGTGNDTFVFGNAAGLSGSLTGGGGVDTIDDSAYATAVALNLAASTITGVGTTFSGVQTFVGSTTADGTLTGPSSGSTYNITGLNSGNVAGVTFSNYSSLAGGAGNNTFQFSSTGSLTGGINGGSGSNTIDETSYTTAASLNLATSTLTGLGAGFTNVQSFLGGTGSNTLTGPTAGSTYNITGANAGSLGGITFSGFGNITGGAGNDVFVLSPGASLTGVLNGGGGSDTLDESAITTAVALNLATSTITGFGNPFANIQSVIGGSNAGNTLTGPTAATTYNLTGPNVGTIGSLSFSNFGNIVGGPGSNSFNFSDSATLSGSLNAGSGSNTINESGVTSAIALNLTASTITGVGTTFAGVQTFIGSTTAGGTLTGPTAGSTYNITGLNAGNVGGVSFSNFSNLVGGPGTNVFKFGATGSLLGGITGGGGTNSIDETAVTTPVSLNLATSTVSGLGASFSNIQAITPGSGANTLTGPAAGSTFNITGANAGNVAGFNFTKFGSLVGGNGNDTFKFSTGGTLSGGINGGGGTNTIDQSALTTATTLNLATSTITSVTGAFANIQNILGGTSTSNQVVGPVAGITFNVTGANIGNAAGVSWTGFGSLVGGAGNNNFVFGSAGALSGTLNGGVGGTNTLDESALTKTVGTTFGTNKVTGVGQTFSNLQIFIGSVSNFGIINGPAAGSTYSITGTNGISVSGVTFVNYSSIVAGAGNDNFVFANGAKIAGSINGGGGTNTVDLSAYTAAASVNVPSSRVTGVGGTYSSIQTFIGGSNATNAVAGAAAATTYNITALNTFNAGGVSFSGFRNITGGAGQNTFVLSNGAGLSGTINGGVGGKNWLDYSAYTTGITVNLATGAATGFGSATSNIYNVRGGSAGLDKLTGNSKGNILLGGGGSNIIVGGTGVSLLIAGTGLSNITGGSGGDLIIGGNTTLDNNALDSILAEWQSVDTYANRINFIKNGGGLNGTNVLNLGTTVIDNLAANVLTGAAGGKNWYFKGANTNITNLQAGEQVN